MVTTRPRRGARLAAPAGAPEPAPAPAPAPTPAPAPAAPGGARAGELPRAEAEGGPPRGAAGPDSSSLDTEALPPPGAGAGPAGPAAAVDQVLAAEGAAAGTGADARQPSAKAAGAKGKGKGKGKSKYGFRFLPDERETLLRWYKASKGQTPRISIRKALAERWNKEREASGEPDRVSHKQIKQWFENSRRVPSRVEKSVAAVPDGPPPLPPASARPGAAGDREPTPGPGTPLDGRRREAVAGGTVAADTFAIASAKRLHAALCQASSACAADSRLLAAPLANVAEAAQAQAWLGGAGALPPEGHHLSAAQEQVDTEVLAAGRVLEESFKVPTDAQVQQQIVAAYSNHLQDSLIAKARMALQAIANLPPSERAANPPGLQVQAGIPRDYSWTLSWALPPYVHAKCLCNSKLCILHGCYMPPEERTNWFMGCPFHPSAMLLEAMTLLDANGKLALVTPVARAKLSQIIDESARTELQLSSALQDVWSVALPQLDEHLTSPTWQTDNLYLLEDHHGLWSADQAAELWDAVHKIADAKADDGHLGLLNAVQQSTAHAVRTIERVRSELPAELVANIFYQWNFILGLLRKHNMISKNKAAHQALLATSQGKPAGLPGPGPYPGLSAGFPALPLASPAGAATTQSAI